MTNREDKSDGELLREFASTGQEAPFEEIVRRYNGLVFGVCRRVLGREHDAEDAAQAVFIALARKAGSLRNRPSIADWLYRAARDVSRVALRSASRRKKREQEVGMNRMRPADKTAAWEKIEAPLDRELGALPEKYRVPLILHYLRHRTEEDIARELGRTRSAISVQLLRAREMLRSRLARQGMAISSGLLFALIAERAAEAAVPATFVASTAKAATLVAAGKAAGTGLVSAQVSSWVEGGLKTMMIAKLKVAAAVFIAASMVGLGGSALAYRALNEPAEQARPVAQVAPKDLPPEIPVAKFGTLHGMIKPRKGECMWLEIPWLANIQEAREKAAREGKPIFLWRSANGHPLGST